MRRKPPKTRLAADHQPEAIGRRLATPPRRSYTRDFVLGAIDGAVTTFAIVSTSAGAGIKADVALILGLANLAADGFSMAASNYLGTKTERHALERARATEELHVDLVPEGEREEVRQIFAAKGLEGDLLDQVTAVITSDRERWIKTMLVEEHGLALTSVSPAAAGLATFAAFSLAGAVPLLPLLASDERVDAGTFLTASVLTGMAFLGVGWLKGHALGRSKTAAALETLLLGSAAAGLGYWIGWALRGLVEAA